MRDELKRRPALPWILVAIGVASACLAILNRGWIGGVCLVLAVYSVAKLIRINVERRDV
jgi:hypothetical protein